MRPLPGPSWAWRHRPQRWARGDQEDEDATSGSRLVPVNLDRSHFRSARWWLLGEAILLLAVGIAGLIAGQSHDDGLGAVVADGELALTPFHSWLLIAAAILAGLATLYGERHWPPPPSVRLQACCCSPSALPAWAPPPAGSPRRGCGIYQVGDSVLFCVLTVYNFALSLWLVANAIEGPAWIRRDTNAGARSRRLRRSAVREPRQRRRDVGAHLR